MNGVIHDNDQKQETSPIAAAWKWVAFTLIASFLLFAHIGCHNDEDNELFAKSAARLESRNI